MMSHGGVIARLAASSHTRHLRDGRRPDQESITTTGSMDSGLVLRTPRNDDWERAPLQP